MYTERVIQGLRYFLAPSITWLLLPIIVGPLYILSTWVLHLISPALRSNSKDYEVFPWLANDKRGFLQYFKDGYECLISEKLFREGYEKIKKSANKLYLLPFPHTNNGFVVFLPKELIAEYARQPDAVVSLDKFVREGMHAKYVIFAPEVLDNNELHKSVTREELGKKLLEKLEVINRELVNSMNFIFTPIKEGSDQFEVNIWTSANKLLVRTANLVFVGAPLCYNQTYLDAAVHYAVTMFVSAVKITLIPKYLRPIMAPLVTRTLWKDRQVVAKFLTPIIEERMGLINGVDDDEVATKILPNDVLSAMLLAGRRDKNCFREYTTFMLINRVLTMNFLSAFSNSITFTNAVYDLVSLPEATFRETIADIRAEIATMVEEEGGWTARLPYKLTLLDSFLRESMRSNPIGETGLERIVTAKGGFTFSNGIHVPEGALLTTPIYGIHHDPELYPGPFNPKRFVRRKGDDTPTLSASTITPEFLSFGLGKPACPGRFFATNLQKLALAHLINDYDIELLEKRPEITRVGTLMQPSTTTLLKMKKRKKN